MREYKLFAQRIGLVGATQFLNNFKGILLLPILTKNMTIEDFGIWAMIMITIGIVPNLATLGFQSVFARFLPSIKKKEHLSDIMYSSLSVVCLTGFLSALIIYLFSKTISDKMFDGNLIVVKMLAVLLFIETLGQLSSSYFRATQQIKKYSTLELLKSILIVIMVSILIFMGKGLIGAIFGLLIESFIVSLIALTIIVSQIGIKIPKFQNFKSYLNYGVPTIPGGISKWVVNSSDRYVIGGYLGTSAVGYYSPGYSLGNIVNSFFQPINFVLPMVLSKYYDENNLEEVKKYLGYSLKYYLAIAVPAVFGLSFLSKPLLELLTTPEIAEKGYLITPLVALSYLIFGVFSIYSKVALLAKKTHVSGVIWSLAAVLNLGLNLLLVPYIGIIAAAATTLFAYIVGLVIMAHYSLRYVEFDMHFYFILKCLFSSTLMSMVIVLWKPAGTFSIIFTIFICMIVYFAILLLLKGFDKEEFSFFKVCN
ncbi:MAG: oligosaccharide flippase family protein [Methanolobus sp.]